MSSTSFWRHFLRAGRTLKSLHTSTTVIGVATFIHYNYEQPLVSSPATNQHKHSRRGSRAKPAEEEFTVKLKIDDQQKQKIENGTTAMTTVAEEEDTTQLLSDAKVDEVLAVVREAYNQPMLALNYTIARLAMTPEFAFISKYVEQLLQLQLSNRNQDQESTLRLLDMGCGTGATMADTLNKLVNMDDDDGSSANANANANTASIEMVGLDFADTMLSVAKQHMRFTVDNIRKAYKSIDENQTKICYNFCNADMRHMCNTHINMSNDVTTTLDTKFDGILSFYAIIHVPRQEHRQILQNCWDLLTEDGVLCLCTGAEDLELDFGSFQEEPMYWSQFNAETSLQMITDAGFVIVEWEIIQDMSSDNEESKHLFVLARKAPRSNELQ